MAQPTVQDQWWNNFKNTGDIESFHNLHTFFYNQLVNFSYSYLKQLDAAEEVVDDVFVSLWEKRESLADIRNIKSYLYTCTRNRSLDLLRKISKIPVFDDDIFSLEKIRMGDDVSEKFENKEFISLLQEAVDKLPKQCKIIFRMHLNDGLNNLEIAEILGLAKKTIEAQIYIAYKKLTVILKDIYNK